MDAASADTPQTTSHHRGPHLGALAIVYTVLFNAGLCAVSAFGMLFGVKPPYFPGPWEPPAVVVTYFQSHTTAALACMFLQFGALIPLGIFVATAVSRLCFLGVRAAGVYIALFGGFMTVFDGAAAGFTLWAMIHPVVIQNGALVLSLFYLSFAFGGPGYSVPMGLFMAGISLTGGLTKLLPRWIAVFGLVLAIAGELSWFSLIFPRAVLLIPFVRFPGFVWLIAVGFALPKAVTRMARPAQQQVSA